VVAPRRLAAIMFTDMVGYTAAAQADETAALNLLREQEELVRPIFASHEGREIKSTGDGFLVEFSSALRAVQCAVEILERLHGRNGRPGATAIRVRVGVHLGDVEERENDIFGDAVNIASRIEPLAPPEGICVSGPVFDQVRNKIAVPFESLGPQSLKNVRYPIDVYRVTLPWDVRPASPSTGPPSRTRLAVLPLTNISPDPKDEYFADGLTEELISALSKIRDLRVIARTSVNQYKSGSKSISQIASELDVGSLLEGSVRKSGSRLRITLQLIDASTQEHIWADRFDRELDDVFAIQTEIAEKTASTLQLELLSRDRDSIRKPPTSDLVAYNLYLRGLHAARLLSFDGYAQSMKFFEEALEKDPRFSLAYSSLANMYVLLAGETIAPSEAFPRAKKLLETAIELDPDSSEAHTARGNLALQHDKDWDLSEREFRRALALNPSDANAHFWYAMLLTVLQRFPEAEAELRLTMGLDPLWRLPNSWLVAVYFYSGEYDAAIAEAEEGLRRYPDDLYLHIALGHIHLRAGRRADALREAELSTGAVSPLALIDRAVLWARLGRPEDAGRLLDKLKEDSSHRYVNPTWTAQLLAALGETDAALEVLERDAREGSLGSLWFSYQGISFDSLRSVLRFQRLLSELHLPSGGAASAPNARSSPISDPPPSAGMRSRESDTGDDGPG